MSIRRGTSACCCIDSLSSYLGGCAVYVVWVRHRLLKSCENNKNGAAAAVGPSFTTAALGCSYTGQMYVCGDLRLFLRGTVSNRTYGTHSTYLPTWYIFRYYFYQQYLVLLLTMPPRKINNNNAGNLAPIQVI